MEQLDVRDHEVTGVPRDLERSQRDAVHVDRHAERFPRCGAVEDVRQLREGGQRSQVPVPRIDSAAMTTGEVIDEAMGSLEEQRASTAFVDGVEEREHLHGTEGERRDVPAEVDVPSRRPRPLRPRGEGEKDLRWTRRRPAPDAEDVVEGREQGCASVDSAPHVACLHHSQAEVRCSVPRRRVGAKDRGGRLDVPPHHLAQEGCILGTERGVEPNEPVGVEPRSQIVDHAVSVTRSGGAGNRESCSAIIEEMGQRSWRVDRAGEVPLPQRFGAADVRFPESLVELCLGEFSRRGDRVLDPFAGFGTTAIVANRMGRQAVAIELLPERVEYIRSRVGDDTLVLEGDARDLADFEIGRVDLVLTSPPYMTRNDHPEDPLTGYRLLGSDYERYVRDVADVIKAAADLLPPQGRAVVNVANLTSEGMDTLLADDLKAALSGRLELVEQVVVLEEPRPAYIRDDYCLVFGSRVASSAAVHPPNLLRTVARDARSR